MSLAIHNFFSMADWPKMKIFLQKAYRSNVALSYRPMFEWQYQVDRFGQNATLVTAMDGPEIVGIHGYVPWPMFWGDIQNPILGAWVMNLFVNEKYRHGLGWVLLKNVCERYELLIGAGASEDSRRLVAKLGWTFYPKTPRYVYLIDLKESAKLAGCEKVTAYYKKQKKITVSGADRLVDLSLHLKEYKPQWEKYPSMHYGTIRSQEYLNWRYLRHPIFRYEMFAMGSWDRPAVCVMRLERSAGDTRALVARCVEFYFPEDSLGLSQAKSLMLSVLKKLEARGVAFVDFIGSSGKVADLLMGLGWQKLPDEEYVLPARLSPIERTLRHQNLEFGSMKKMTVPKWTQMYITKSDGDEDRPTKSPT